MERERIKNPRFAAMTAVPMASRAAVAANRRGHHRHGRRYACPCLLAARGFENARSGVRRFTRVAVFFVVTAAYRAVFFRAYLRPRLARGHGVRRTAFLLGRVRTIFGRLTAKSRDASARLLAGSARAFRWLLGAELLGASPPAVHARAGVAPVSGRRGRAVLARGARLSGTARPWPSIPPHLSFDAAASQQRNGDEHHFSVGHVAAWLARPRRDSIPTAVRLHERLLKQAVVATGSVSIASSPPEN
jgi:hypothetical protein